MSNASDFIIENGSLVKYVGPGGEVVIPEGVDIIPSSWHFWCETAIKHAITRIIVPEGVTEIGGQAFGGFPNLEEVILPESLKELGVETFIDCPKLRNVTYPKTIKKLDGSNFGPWGVRGIEENKNFQLRESFLLNKKGTDLIAYLPQDGVCSVRIPEGITAIRGLAFSHTVLDEVWIPEGVTTIYGDAFWNHKIRLIRLPKSAAKVAKDFTDALTRDENGWDGCVYICFYDAALTQKRFGRDSVYPVYLGGELTDLPVKMRYDAVKGFAYAIYHGVDEIHPYRESYVNHIRSNKNTYVKASKENEDILRLMLEENLLEQKEAEKLLKGIDGSSVEIKTMLMEYIRKLADNADPFDLDADVKDPSQRLKMEQRRAEIQNQHGIQGVAFVATGKLDQFGTSNEWSPGIDYSDLKAYIEQRGGYLRAAVSTKTDYLICNDPASVSDKMERARELGVAIISEEEFLSMADET